jgi:phosphoglycolate phosphatase
MQAKQADFSYILFDLDGTLTDSKPGILNCVQYALEQCGMPEPDQEKLMPFVGPPLIESFQSFCGMSPEEATFAVSKYRERFGTVGMFENAVYAGIPQLLEQLQNQGYRLAVATSKPEVYTLQILEHFQLTHFFTVIAGSDIHVEGETKADIIRLALRRLHLPEEHPNGVVMVGDRKHDLIGSHRCGIPCIGVRYGYAPEGELEAYQAEWIVEDVKALAAFFQKNQAE